MHDAVYRNKADLRTTAGSAAFATGRPGKDTTRTRRKGKHLGWHTCFPDGPAFLVRCGYIAFLSSHRQTGRQADKLPANQPVPHPLLLPRTMAAAANRMAAKAVVHRIAVLSQPKGQSEQNPKLKAMILLYSVRTHPSSVLFCASKCKVQA